MNQAEIIFQKVKRVAKDNTKCQTILLKLFDINRDDIIEQIAEINKTQWNAITPEGIVKMYEEVGEDLEKFVAKYDKAMKDAGWIRRNFYNGYEKGISDDCYY